MGRRDAGKQYLDEILGLLSEDDRKVIADKLAKDDIVDKLGDGVLRQQDYTRQTDELRAEREALNAKHAELEGWLESQKGYLEDYKKIKPEFERLKGSRGDDPPGDKPPVLSKELEERLKKLDEIDGVKARQAELEQVGPALMIEFHKLDRRHRKEFNEDLDFDELVKHAQDKKLNIRDAYSSKYGERLVEAEKKRRDEEIKAAEQRGRDAAMREVRSQLPHVVDTQEPSTLDGLQVKDQGRRAAVKAAVDAFYTGTAGQGS